MTLKGHLLASVGALGAMSPAERAMGRYMRAPDGHDGGDDTGGDDCDFEADTVGNDDEGLDNPGDDGFDGEQQDGEDPDGEEGEQERPGEPEEGGDDDDGEQPLPKGVQRRIDRLTRRLREAETALRGRGEPQRREQPSKARSDDQGGDKKPLVTDFDTYEEYIEAIADWKAEQRIQAAEAKRTTESAESAFKQRFAEGRKKFADFDRVVTDDVEITGAMTAAIKETDDPAGVIYFLGKNPDEADRIASLSPAKQTLEIGKIEDRIARQAKQRQGAGNETSRRTSRAPEPIKPVRAGGRGAPAKAIEEIDDVDEFIRRRNKEEGINRG